MTRKPLRLGTGLLGWILLWVGSSLGLSAQTIDRPWGVAALSSGELIVMETDGRMLRVNPDSEGLKVLKRSFRPFFPIDVTTGARDGGDVLFVNLRFRTPQGAVFNRVTQFSLRGKALREGWMAASDSFAGLAVDAKTETLWLVESGSSEIHMVKAEGLRSGKEVSLYRRLLRLPGVGILGPLAYDDAGQRLFVADSLNGTVYMIPVGTSPATATRIADGLGEPQALAVDHRNQRLYVADVAAPRIWVVDLDDVSAGKELFARPQGLRSPVDLAVTPDGTLWIADPEANRLVALDPNGDLVRTIR